LEYKKFLSEVFAEELMLMTLSGTITTIIPELCGRGGEKNRNPHIKKIT